VTQTFEELLEQHTGLLKLETQRFLDRFRREDQRLEWDDAFQVALLTLWRCMAKFDPARGVKFSTYLGSALYKNLTNHARATLPKIRCGPNGNSWRTVSVTSWDALSPRAQALAMQGYQVPEELVS